MSLWPLLHWLAIHLGAENESGVYLRVLERFRQRSE